MVMSNVVELKKHPKRVRAIELLVCEPDITNKELAKRLHVTEVTISKSSLSTPRWDFSSSRDWWGKSNISRPKFSATCH